MRNIGNNPTAASTILSNLSTNKPAVSIRAIGGGLTNTVLSNSVDNPSTIYFTESGIMLAGYLVAEGLSTNQRKVIDHLGNVITVSDNAATTSTGIQFNGTNVTILADNTDGEIHLVSNSGVFVGSNSTSANLVATQSWVTNAINDAAAQGGYTLPTAATNTKGGIKVDGTTFTVNSSDQITLTGYSVTSGNNNVRNITISGTSTTISGNTVYIPTATYVGNSSSDSTKKVATKADATAAAAAVQLKWS